MKGISLDDVSALIAEGSLREVIRISVSQATSDRIARRALVLRHPDLAQRLTEQPLNFTKPEHWNGAIPPETWREEPNNSPLRPALLELIAEAEARESQPYPP